MLIQASTPRFIVSIDEHPQHIVIHTLAKPGTSSGEVHLGMSADIEEGRKASGPVILHQSYPIEGTDLEGLEYYVPFDILFGTDKPVYDEAKLLASSGKSALTMKPKREGQLRGAQLALLIAGGINLTIKSAFRFDTYTYQERIMGLQLMFPVTGGGIVRFSDTLLDLRNPTFDPYAPRPKPQQDLVLQNALNRTHKPTSSGVEDRKRARLAAAAASIANELPPKEVSE